MASPRETLGRDQNVRPDVELTGGNTFGSGAQGTAPVHLEARMDALVESSSATTHTITLTTRGSQGATYTRPLAAGGAMLIKGRGNQSFAIDVADASVVWVTGPAGTLWPANPSVGGGAPTVADGNTLVNVTPNANNTAQMAGLGNGSLTNNLVLTPKKSGNVLVVINVDLNPGAAGRILTVQLQYGTGIAPVLNGAAAGTFSGFQAETQGYAACADRRVVVGVITGLTLGTAYWFDLGVTVPNDGSDIVYVTAAAVSELPT